MTDKIAECQQEISPSPAPDTLQKWELFTDDACNDDGAGAGLRLITPNGKEFTYAIQLDFTTNNNGAEYEALLAGLRIAKKMGGQHVEAYVDSILVANHIDGSYEAREPSMILYLEHTKDLIHSFE